MRSSAAAWSFARAMRASLDSAAPTKPITAGAAAIARYLDEPAGRFIQSVKSWLPSRSFTHTQIRHRPVTLEDLVALVTSRVRKGEPPPPPRAEELSLDLAAHEGRIQGTITTAKSTGSGT